MFPNVPGEIFDLWFDARIEKYGVPSDTAGWRSLLRFQSISTWKKLKWTEVDLDLSREPFTQATIDLIENLRAWVFEGALNNATLVMGGEAKTKAHRIDLYAGNNHALPSKLIFLGTPHGLEIVDGCHRLAVFAECRRRSVARCVINPVVRAWLGAP